MFVQSRLPDHWCSFWAPAKHFAVRVATSCKVSWSMYHGTQALVPCGNRSAECMRTRSVLGTWNMEQSVCLLILELKTLSDHVVNNVPRHKKEVLPWTPQLRGA